ncbi:restriction endonuclease subunit S (plasmid) [Morganella morganii]|uniref:Restriction endonuclease subunit S n=1 Tax=Morganella morganii TaxID=582 RepID=A0A433ZQX6_MORMO|nr:restriction endonuclease subunit S [Morganella morganii]RUT64496.1 restriction endonuclease subunit S [Morganella morganii]
MSKIEQLIQQLCPDGVEWRPVSEIFITKNGYTPSTSNATFWADGTIPWFRMEDIRENGRILGNSLQKITSEAIKGGRLFPANSIVVATSATIGEHALITVPHLSNQRFTSLSLSDDFIAILDMKFVFYYCFVLCEWCKNNTTTSSFASVDMDGFKKFQFPIPPLEIQQEIVAILDKFTALEAELEAELEARKKQYEFYRNALLTFGTGKPHYSTKIEKLIQQLCPDGVELKTLGDVGNFVRGNGLQKKELTDVGIGAIHYGQIYTHYGVIASETKSFVSPEFANRLRKAKNGDLIIATTSENDDDVCKAVAWLGKEDIAISGDAYIYTHSLEPKYVAYFFQSEAFQIQKIRHITGTKVKRVSGNSMAQFLIPEPPLEIQKEIVGILDKFDALVNDISTGLPAEIAARRRQYEYYREKLLTFKRKEV